MLLSSIYPPGVYFQGVKGTALTRGRAGAPSSLPTAGGAYADKGVDLQVETITDTARVLMGRQRFGQVMSNLLSNALRHTPAGR